MTKRKWRKLDNAAKIFSVERKKYTNTFRLSVILKEEVDRNCLKNAVKKALINYPNYGVKIKSGFFWNYLELNDKNPLTEENNKNLYKSINLTKNNEYLFKVTYYNNRINLDVCHILTDGIGATVFLKAIIYNYLNIKYKIKLNPKDKLKNTNFTFEDEHLKQVNKKLQCKERNKKAFNIKEKANILKNKTYHYILDLKNMKEACKKNNASISEYLTALYIYAIYKTVYKEENKKDIVMSVPVDLRKIYNIETHSNFFTCMNIYGNVVNNKKITFKKILRQVCTEFKQKLTVENLQKYLSRDVKLGTNVGIKLIPMFMKKTFMKYCSNFVINSPTATMSNLGVIKISDKYKKYIDNIMAFVTTNKVQKTKSTVCSYENKLTVTLNSTIVDNKLEKMFHKLLTKHFGKIIVQIS